jgi:hypothetical protein
MADFGTDWWSDLQTDGSGDWLTYDDWGNDANLASDYADSLSGNTSNWSWLSDVGKAAIGALGSQGGMTALGGLLGYMGSKNNPSSITQTQEPWTPQQPFLIDAFQGAAAAAKGNPLTTKANENYTALLGGPTVNPMLGLDNPYLQQSIDLANADVTRAMNPALIAANRASGSYGNSGVAETYGRALGDAYSQNATNMRMQDYAQQQGLQQQAVNNTLGFTTNAQNWAAQPSQNYANTVRGTYGGTSTTPLYSNPYSGLLGGAMAGYTMGK